MTHHTRQGIAVLIWIVFLWSSVSPPLIRNGLAEQSAAPTISDLIYALQNPDPIIRRGATVALGGFGTAAIPALIKALQDRDPDVRHQAAFALERMGARTEVIPALTDALQASDPGVRHAAAVALGRIGAKVEAAIPVLIEALQDPDPNSRRGAAEALGKVDAKAEAVSCSRPLREDTNVDPFREIDQALDRVAAQLLPPAFSHAVSDKDLCDAYFSSE